MGSMIKSHSKCGFESEVLYVGGGMMDYGGKCGVPCYCDKCKLVTTINILTIEGEKGYYRCPKCKKRIECYGEIKEESFEDDVHYVFDWSLGEMKRYYLKDQSYYCPKCENNDLQFQPVGNWD